MKKLVTITPEDRVGRARDLMDSGNFRHLPVIEGIKLVGILSSGDIRNVDDSFAVNEMMTRDPVTATPTTTIEQAIHLMLELKISALPIVIDEKPVWILTATDILQGLLQVERSETLAAFLSRTVADRRLC